MSLLTATTMLSPTNTSSQGGFSSSMVDGAADVGKINSWISAGVVTLLGAVALVIAYFLFTNPNPDSTPASGTVQPGVSCTLNKQTDSNGNTSSYYACTMTVQYNDTAGTSRSAPLSTSGSNNYQAGNSIAIEYNPTNFSDVRVAGLSNAAIGGIIVGVTLLVVGLTYVNTYFVMKSKSYAALTGTADAIGMVASAVNPRR